MTTLVKLIIALSVGLLNDFYHHAETKALPSQMYAAAIEVSATPKEKAFQILENKCNVCHNRRNKQRVFNLENMNAWAADVYKQVFIKKRMPKGKNIKLSSQEYQDLLTWISTTPNI